MHKRMMTFSMVVVAGLLCPWGMAADSQPASSPDAAAAAPAESEKAKSHEVEAEVVAVDGEKHTITLKTAGGESTAPVDAKAQAGLAGLKPGQKVTVVCRDDEKGEHKAVEEIKTSEAPAEKPAP